ncbi:hypothetical protein ABIB40_003960 [Pedobacter sp. UYP30]
MFVIPFKWLCLFYATKTLAQINDKMLGFVDGSVQFGRRQKKVIG